MFTVCRLVATALVVLAGSADARSPSFRHVHTQQAPTGSTPEIAASDPTGRLVVYTDPNGSLGFLDIRALPGAPPTALPSLPVDGEPTSVVVTPDARFIVAVVRGGTAGNRALVLPFASALAGVPSVAHEIALPGEPDAIAVSDGGRYLAVAIENEETPSVPGMLAIIDAVPATNPLRWTVRDVALSGIAAVNPADPEPEYVAVRGSLAAVTLQENNHIALVDLEAGVVVGHFSAGGVTQRADVTRNNDVSFTGAITSSPRTPDGVAWTRAGRLVTANEGEANLTGGRGLSTFSSLGAVLFDTSESLEVAASGAGLYPDARSPNKGTELENVAIARFGAKELAIAASERGHFLSVHAVHPDGSLELLQLLPLPNGASPEGVLPIPSRGLVVSANEGDGTLAFFALGGGGLDIVGAPNPSSPLGDPIWWSALSGFSAAGGAHLVAVPDAAAAPSRVFTIDTAPATAVVTASTVITHAGAPARFDLEGIALRLGADGAPDARFGAWVVSEGDDRTAPQLTDKLIELDASFTVTRIVELPPAVRAQALRWGFEGVAVTGRAASEHVYVAFQREWRDDAPGWVRIGRYTPATDAWAFFHYPLDFASSGINALATGLSDLVALDDVTFLVIERDSLKGAAAALKRVYSFSIAGLTPTPCDTAAAACPVDASARINAKVLVRDLIAQDRLTLEKVEGLAIRASDGALMIGADNDGVGETRLIVAE